MSKAEIYYGGGTAKLFGDFSEGGVEDAFYKHANQCFGIRKSIMDFQVRGFFEDAELPEPWSKIEGAETVLMHSGDIIVWDADGNKIKSEWD